MKQYLDLATGRIVRIDRALTKAELETFREAGQIILDDPSPLEEINELARQWVSLTEDAVRLADGELRNMDQLLEVNCYGQPVA